MEIIEGSTDRSKIQNAIRYYEISAASSLSIPFDESWYRIEPLARAYHIAHLFASNALTNLQMKQAQAR